MEYKPITCPCCGKEMKGEAKQSDGSLNCCPDCDLTVTVSDRKKSVEVATSSLSVALAGGCFKPLEAVIQKSVDTADGKVWLTALRQQTKIHVDDWHSSIDELVVICYEILTWYDGAGWLGEPSCRRVIESISGIPERSCPFCGKPMKWHLTNCSDYETSFVCGDCGITLSIAHEGDDDSDCIADVYNIESGFAVYTSHGNRDDETLMLGVGVPWGDDIYFDTSLPRNIGPEEHVKVAAKLYKELEPICSTEGIIRGIKSKLVEAGVREAKS